MEGNPVDRDPGAELARFDAARLLSVDPGEAVTAKTTAAATRDRLEQGRAKRAGLPRRSFGEWQPARDRPDPIAILEEQAATRVADLVPVRHGRMLASPFAFFRGAAGIMARDLGAEADSGIRVQCCGDAHLGNFGTFAAPDRKLVFDLNDFDETLPAPFEWDLKRLSASIEIAARDNGHASHEGRAAVERAIAAYQGAMSLLAGMRLIDSWYARIDVDRIAEVVAETALPQGVSATRREIRKARRRTGLRALRKLTEGKDGELRIREDPPLIVRFDEQEYPGARETVENALADYATALQPDRRALLERYRFVDFARKVVGVGSVGTEAFIVLLMGDRDDDPLFLQLKEAKESVLAPFAGASEYDHQGERVVQGQRLMQGASDSFLGWLTGHGSRTLDYYVRQLRDMKGAVDIEGLYPRRFRAYAELCGATLARAHARAGDAALISGYIGTGEVLRDSLARYASAYADRNELDHALLVDAVAGGRVEAVTGL